MTPIIHIHKYIYTLYVYINVYILYICKYTYIYITEFLHNKIIVSI